MDTIEKRADGADLTQQFKVEFGPKASRFGKPKPAGWLEQYNARELSPARKKEFFVDSRVIESMFESIMRGCASKGEINFPNEQGYSFSTHMGNKNMVIDLECKENPGIKTSINIAKANGHYFRVATNDMKLLAKIYNKSEQLNCSLMEIVVDTKALVSGGRHH